jgi:hypothetical protein
MPDVVMPEPFPMSVYTRDAVEAERQARLKLAGVISSVISTSGSSYILTTTFKGPDTTDAAPAASPKPPAKTAAAKKSAAAAAKPEVIPAQSADPTSPTMQTALMTAVRMHEIGDKTPYKLYFAGKGKSGASFGFMQGDMHAGPDLVRTAFTDALSAAGISDDHIAAIAKQLAAPLIGDPLSPGDSNLANSALDASRGRTQVDGMDKTLFGGCCAELEQCTSAASKAGRQIAPKAQLYMLMWINMSGKPTTLLDWISGSAVTMAKAVPAPGPIIDGEAMEAYLLATPYFSENPQNFPHIQACAAAGMNTIPVA